MPKRNKLQYLPLFWDDLADAVIYIRDALGHLQPVHVVECAPAGQPHLMQLAAYGARKEAVGCDGEQVVALDL